MKPQRIMVTTRRDQWWQIASQGGEFVDLPGKQINLNAQCIAIDPATTSPNVTVGLSIERGAPPIYLRPGESIVFPTTVRQVWVTNPTLSHIGVDWIVGPNSIPLGTVGLLTGSTADLIAWKARANRTRPNHPAAIIGAGVLTADPVSVVAPPADGTVVVPSVGMEVVRVRLLPLNADGTIIAPPADLAGTLRVFTGAPFPVVNDNAGAGVNPANLAAFRGALDHDTGRSITDVRTFPWCADAGSDFTISQYQTVADFIVGVGGLAYWQLIGLAGTGVTSLLAVVEGG